MVQNLHRVTDFYVLLTRDVVIHQNVIRPLEWAFLNILERSPQSLEAVQIDSINNLERARGRELPNYRTHDVDMWQSAQNIAHFNSNRRAAYGRQVRGSRRLHDHIGSNAGSAIPGIVHDAVGKA